MTTLNTGAPHFKSVMKQHRHANYTIHKVLNEFVDNTIKKSTKIHINTQVDDSETLQEIKVSDDYINGFENIYEMGINNPFNMGHIKAAHDDDSETSEFGVGMKAGALSAANQLHVYTRSTDHDDINHYFEVNCDFIRMANEEDVNASYNPRIREISYEEYRDRHPFEYGSTLILSKIRDCIYPKTTQEAITNDIANRISETYSRLIHSNLEIYVNNTLVQPTYDFFADPKCIPFTIRKDLYILEKFGQRVYIIHKTKERSVWQEYNNLTKVWDKLNRHNNGLDYIQELLADGYRHMYSQIEGSGYCMGLNSTFVLYSDKFHNIHKENDAALPEDMVSIYKDNRNYGRQSFVKHNNGIHNYTLHEINFGSKKLGKDIGITFNKEILMNGNNDLIVVIKAALSDSRIEFSSDTSTKKNELLCEKAIKKGLIDPKTCNELKLYSGHRPKPSLPSTANPIANSTSTTAAKSFSAGSVKSSYKTASTVKTNYSKVVSDTDNDETEEDSEEEDSEEEDSDNAKDAEDDTAAYNETEPSEDAPALVQVAVEMKIEEGEVEKAEVAEPHNQDPEIEEGVDTKEVVDEIPTSEDRKRRTLAIMDRLYKSINGDNEHILPDEVLTLIEKILQ